MRILKKSPTALAEALKALREGEVIICPTDTVYGFVADSQNKKAVEKIFAIKKRLRSKPLPLFVKDLKMAHEVADINEKQAKILTLRLRSGQAKYWPGKYTFVFQKKTTAKLYGVGKTTIALRRPRYKFLQDLLQKIDRPLVQTSVNLSSHKSLNKKEDIEAVFGNNKLINLMIDGGEIKKPASSKIIDLSKGKAKVLRS